MQHIKVSWAILIAGVIPSSILGTTYLSGTQSPALAGALSSQAKSAPSAEVDEFGVPRQDRKSRITIFGKTYEITFDDEFDNPESISRSGDFDGAKWYNGIEQCCMSASNGLKAVNFPTKIDGVSVDPYKITAGTGLEITLSKSNDVWYSGVLTSVDRFGKGFSQQYGYFEIKAKLPHGPGTWPAFWMKSLSNLTTGERIGEIDVFEQYGKNEQEFCTTYHDWSRKTTPYYNCNNPTSNLTEDYHTWGFLWTEEEAIVLFDGKEMNRTSTPSVMKQPFYLIMDMGLGGGWPTDKTPSPSTMQVKYVRSYRYDSDR